MNKDGLDEETSIDEGSDSLLIWRQEGMPLIEQLDSETYALLVDINKGSTLPELAENHPALATLLPKLLSKGWIVGFKTG